MNKQSLFEFCQSVAQAGSFDALNPEQKALLLILDQHMPKSAHRPMLDPNNKLVLPPTEFFYRRGMKRSAEIKRSNNA